MSGKRPHGAPPAPGEPDALALDGKALGGRRKPGAPAAHLLSVLSHRLGLTLWQQPVGDKTHEIPVLEKATLAAFPAA